MSDKENIGGHLQDLKHSASYAHHSLIDEYKKEWENQFGDVINSFSYKELTELEAVSHPLETEKEYINTELKDYPNIDKDEVTKIAKEEYESLLKCQSIKCKCFGTNIENARHR